MRICNGGRRGVWPWVHRQPVLRGADGSGKSTLMKIYARLTCDEHFDLFGHAYAMTDDAIVTSRDALYESLGFAR